jgi:hypothetical protein
VLQCPKCPGRMQILAYLTERRVVKKILDHLGIASEPPRRGRSATAPMIMDRAPEFDSGSGPDPEIDFEPSIPISEPTQRIRPTLNSHSRKAGAKDDAIGEPGKGEPGEIVGEAGVGARRRGAEGEVTPRGSRAPWQGPAPPEGEGAQPSGEMGGELPDGERGQDEGSEG